MDFYPALHQILLLLIMIAAGYIGGKTTILGKGSDDVIAKLVFNITLPCLLLTSISGMEMTPEIWRNGLGVMFFAALIHGLQMGVGFLSARLLKLSERKSVIHMIHTFKGNTIFIGFPLIDALFPGGEGLLYAALYNLTSNIYMWTIGVMFLDKSKKSNLIQNLSKLLNINTIALLIGLTMLVFSIDFPSLITGSVGKLGAATSPLAMIFIGLKFSGIRVRAIVTDISAWVYSFNKLIFIPVLSGLLISGVIALGLLTISDTARMVILLQAATPGFAMMMIIAKIYNADTETAIKNFFLSTGWSVLTLPLMYYLLTVLFF
ncbi:MAG TPA: AEC family transporter [Bacteroidales bacterium]|nr:AEC family transporter [Bacteroidales bacterium]